METTALLIAVSVVVSCAEQSPDKFLAPEFGPVVVNLDGCKATVQCNVTGPEDSFKYGFILQEGDEIQPQEIILKPYGGVLRTELNGLMPATDYNLKAFATNGINTVTSSERTFKTGEENNSGGGDDGDGNDGTDSVNIPDPAFKKYILSKFDSNNDGSLSLEEAEGINVIECCSDDIRSIEGVEYFTNLERLICRGSGTDSGRRTGMLTKVDLSKNYYLRYLEVDSNNLTELCLPDRMSNITDIHCIQNKLDSLDLSNCPKLKLLWCWNNSLTSLDLSHNLLLTDLRCAQNDFSNGLDVSANTELRYYCCNDTFMPAIDVSSNKELIELVCYNNVIREIDVSHNPELTKLECSNNLLKNIDVSHNTLLSVFTFENNYLKEIDVSHNPNIRFFNCSDNQFSSIDISMLAQLKELSIGDNDITEPVDLSLFPELTDYGGNNLPLSRLPDFSNNPKLTSIHISSSGGAIYIDEAFFRQWPEIRDFNISSFPGESIDLSLNKKMSSIWMPDMPNIRVLDLSASPNLKFVCLNECRKLEKIYLNKNVDIDELELELNNVDATIEFK